MNLPVVLNGKSYQCIHCWEVMPTKIFQRLFKEWDMDKEAIDRDYFKLFGILTESKFSQMEASTENEVTIWSAIKWLIETPMPFSDKLPTVLKIGKSVYDVPRDIAELSIGQNIHLKNELQGAKFREEKIAIATAIFMQPIIDKKPFDMKRAKVISHQLEELPAYLIYPIGFFLLKRALKTGLNTQNLWSRTLSSLNSKLKRMWRHSPELED